MPILVNEGGVVVSVSDETATRLGPDWELVEAEQPKRTPGRPKKTENK